MIPISVRKMPMKVGEFLKNKNKYYQREKVDLVLFHCDLFYEMEFTNINMGLLYIATYLKRQGFKVDVLGAYHLYKMSNSQFLRYIKRKNPSVCGFYTISDNIEIVLDTAQRIKKELPKSKIVLGGPLASALQDKFLRYPFVDIVITGEGEYAMEKVLRKVLKGDEDFSSIEGAIYKRDGKVYWGVPPKPIENLDDLPFPDVTFFSNQSVFQVVSGRGCPYKCTFCFQSGHGLKFRFRSASNVLKEIIGVLETLPVVGFDFIDDAFIVDPKRCMEIAKGLYEYRQKSRRDFIFFAQGRANILAKHPEIIPVLAKSGLARMQLGIESGDPYVLEMYNKKITLDQVRKVVDEVRKTEMMLVVGGFIIGGPFESRKTFENTLNFAIELIEMAPGGFETSAGFLGAYPGTEIAKNPKKFGLTLLEEDFAKGFSLTDVQFTTEFLGRDEIRGLMKEFEEKATLAMAEVLPKIPKKLLRLHYWWARRYRMYSRWYSLFLGNLGAIRDYFKFLDSPLFSTIDRIPVEEIMDWYPMRSWEKRTYLPDGTLKLPQSVSNYILEKKEEILAYELASGKLKLKDVLKRLKGEVLVEYDEDSILNNFLIPFYRKLNDIYLLVFHK